MAKKYTRIPKIDGYRAKVLAESTSLTDSAARFFNFNASDSSTTLVLLGALVLVGALAAIAFAGGSSALASPFAYDRNSYQQGYGQYDPYAQQQYR